MSRLKINKKKLNSCGVGFVVRKYAAAALTIHLHTYLT